MEDIRPNSVVCFDNRYTNNQISKFKVLLHFLAPSMQDKFAIYIKFMELQYTLRFFGSFTSYSNTLSSPACCSYNNTFSDTTDTSSSTNAYKEELDLDLLCEELFPYCEPYEKEKIVQLRSTFQTMQNLRSMMEMMDTLKELFPEGMGSGDGQGGFNPEILAAMSSMFGGGDMDLSAMAGMFGGNI